MSTLAVAPAPHLPARSTVRRVMGDVLIALIPGAIAQVWYFGVGVGVQIVLAVFFALGFESIMLRLRGQSQRPWIADLSAPVTAVLFALCIPAWAPWWIAGIAMCAAIVFAKHLYGGLGRNLFNPAMVGYAVVLIAFPLALARWPAPGSLAGREWIANGYALGGLYLLWRRVIHWQVPVALLGTTILLTALAWLIDPDVNPLPLQHVFSGGLMLAAFFIATDPVTGAATPRGRLIFGAGVAALTLAIRRWGAYPDGIAFAVLLMNACVPLLDRLTIPRVYGYGRSRDD